jgi:hypothetical protein
MAKRFPAAPAHPERNCWGCEHYCAAQDMRCGNGSDRTQHPIEVLGAEWMKQAGYEDLCEPVVAAPVASAAGVGLERR